MSIKGIGTDLVSINRVRKLWQKFGDKFAHRILSNKELEIYYEHQEPSAYLAKRFAGKEAVVKALGTGIGKVFSFHDIAILNHKNGQPIIEFAHEVQPYLDKLQIRQTYISLSDEQNYALAFVVLT